MTHNKVVGIRKGKAVESIAQSVAEAVYQRLDPIAKRASVALTFDDLFNRWLNDYAKQHYQEASWRNYERMYRSYFHCWKDENVYDIRRSEVQAWQARLAENIAMGDPRRGKTTANRARELMRMVYNRAIEWELIPDNYNPATKIRKFATQSRERFLQADELPRFFAALQTLRYEAVRDCLLMHLLTAQRSSNVKRMAWAEIDFARKVWTIPANKMKNRSSHVVPLTPDAVVILRRRHHQRQNEPWVFPSRLDRSKPISKLEKAWKQLINKAGISDLRIHDLRRSHASWQAIERQNLIVIAKTLNHKDLNSTAIYARLNVDDVRKAMTAANQAILRAAGASCSGGTRARSAIGKLGPGFEFDRDDEWIDAHRAAELTGLSVDQLQRLRSRNEGPPYLKSGIVVGYKVSMLRAWMAGRR